MNNDVVKIIEDSEHEISGDGHCGITSVLYSLLKLDADKLKSRLNVLIKYKKFDDIFQKDEYGKTKTNSIIVEEIRVLLKIQPNLDESLTEKHWLTEEHIKKMAGLFDVNIYIYNESPNYGGLFVPYSKEYGHITTKEKLCKNTIFIHSNYQGKNSGNDHYTSIILNSENHKVLSNVFFCKVNTLEDYKFTYKFLFIFFNMDKFDNNINSLDYFNININIEIEQIIKNSRDIDDIITKKVCKIKNIYGLEINSDQRLLNICNNLYNGVITKLSEKLSNDKNCLEMNVQSSDDCSVFNKSNKLLTQLNDLRKKNIIKIEVTAIKGSILDNIPKNCCIVDPAGLGFISGKYNLTNAGGASGAIYKEIKLENFNYDVKNAIKKEGDAFYKSYNDYHVIHVVGPDFSLNNLEKNKETLMTAYKNIFLQFLESEKEILRLLPVSGGIYSGNRNDLPDITKKALDDAYNNLTDDMKYYLSNKSFDLYTFSEFDKYSEKFPVSARSPSGRAPSGRSVSAGPGRSPDPNHVIKEDGSPSSGGAVAAGPGRRPNPDPDPDPDPDPNPDPDPVAAGLNTKENTISRSEPDVGNPSEGGWNSVIVGISTFIIATMLLTDAI
jgi:hypothetical protein